MYLIEWGFWQMATESEAARKAYEAELTPKEKRQDLYESELAEEMHFQSVSENPRARGPVFAFNDIFLDIRCGGSEEKRGLITLATLGAIAPAVAVGLYITTGFIWMDITDPEGRSVITILTTLIMLSVTSTLLYLYSKYGIHLTRLEMLTSRHLLIRFNRVTQQVHLHRPKFGWTITLYDLDDIQELRPLFSPSPLTPHMLDNYRLLEDEYRNSLPAIDIARFIQPSDAPPQPHVIKHDQLGWVADFKAQNDADLQALLDLQPFNNDQIVSPHASRQALAPLVNQSKPRGAAIVIEDAIGITQELNAWRNAAVDDVKTKWLERTVEPGVDNERKLLVAQSFLEIEKLYPQMMAEQIIKREVMAENIRNQPYVHAEIYAFSERARQQADAHDERMKPHLAQFERDVRAKVQARQEAGEFSKKFDQKYGHLVDRQSKPCNKPSKPQKTAPRTMPAG
ncbi:hypothetical protein [Pseudomonas putida]|uniref:hypothetical protein n=1 Tax=Pseudomonas putida TaxID=303 RepID=UPI001F4DDBAE|nr:hypothetical protein [Pseudomonas putida]